MLAQSSIDSLENVLRQSLPDSQRVKVLNDLLYYYNDVNASRSYELGKEAIELSKKITNREDIALCYLHWAIACEANGDYLASLEYNFMALREFEAFQDSVSISAVLNNVGIAYNQLGDYGLAAHYIMRAIEIDEYRNDTVGMCSDYINLAEAYFNSKNYARAKLWANKALRDSRQTGDHSLEGYVAETLATILMEQNKLDSAEYFIRLAHTYGEEFENEYLSYRSLGHFGKLYYKKAKLDSAKFYLNQCIQVSHGKYHSDILVPAMILLVKCYITEKNWSAAEQQALTALSLSKQINSTSIAMESTALLADIYKAQQQPMKAMKYLQLSLAFKDSVLTALRQGSIEARTFDLTLEKEKREKERAVSNLEERDKLVTFQRFMLALGTVALLSLIVLMILIRKAATERRKVNALLMQKNLELNNLNREVSALIDAIVHDLKSPLNSLQGIMYLLEMEVDEKATKAREFITKGHEVIRNGHGIIAELLELRDLEDNPLVVKYEQVRLDAYVEGVVNGFASYAQQKKITFDMQVTNEVAILEPVLLKRILDNLISNAIKYSPADRTVFITAKRSDAGIKVEVRDQGPGFQEKDIPKVFGKFQKLSARPTGGESSHGLGLAIVQLIVNYLGGTIELQTKWGEGATFILNVPEQKS